MSVALVSCPPCIVTPYRRQVHASVTNAMLVDSNPRNIYYVYEVTVRIGPFSYTLARRYKQFASLQVWCGCYHIRKVDSTILGKWMLPY